MPVVMGGNHPDLSYLQILQRIVTKIKEFWLIDDPPVDDPEPLNNVSFNHDWYDDGHEFSVSVILDTTTRGFGSLGATAYDYSMFIEFHIFVKQITEEHPILAGNIEKEISRLLMANSTIFGGGISLVVPTEFRRAGEEDPTSTLWHSMMTAQVIFMKFVVP